MSPQDDTRNLFAGADQERLPQGQGNPGSTPRHHSSRHNDALVNNAYSIMRRGEPDPPDTTPYPELWMTDVEDGGEETTLEQLRIHVGGGSVSLHGNPFPTCSF